MASKFIVREDSKLCRNRRDVLIGGGGGNLRKDMSRFGGWGVNNGSLDRKIVDSAGQGERGYEQKG